MKRITQIILLLCYSVFSFSQVKEEDNKPETSVANIKSTDKDSLKIYNPTIDSYHYWTENQPRAIFDTILTIDKYYKNRMYNHKDYFGTMPFSNIGETFNPLLYTTRINTAIDLIPLGKSYNLTGIDEVRYFDVQTPMTEFQYNNGYKQGHSLSSLFTHSPNSLLNYSIQYEGLRSDGKYQNQISSHNTVLATVNYHTKNQRYKFWTHFLVTNSNNQENGGIRYPENFESGDSRFKNRGNLQVNLTGAESKYQQRRFYLAQQYGIFKTSDTLKNEYPLSVKNVFSYETTHYKYSEKGANNLYFLSKPFDSIKAENYINEKSLRRVSNVVSLLYKWSDKLSIDAGLKYENLELYADRRVDPSILYPLKIKDNRLGIAGNLTFNWKEGVVLKTQAEALTGDKFKNSYFVYNYLTIQPIQNYFLELNFGVKSQIPSLNLLYNQSFYKGYNYYLKNPDNERTIQLGGTLKLKPFNTRISAQIFNINNYTYLTLDSIALPKQANSAVRIVQIGLQNSFKYKNFNLETHLAYQKVTENSSILPLPEFIGRGTLYYQNKIFKKQAELQAGINLYYFTKFRSREFFPIVNEFVLPSDPQPNKIGNFPMIDLFIHFKVKRMLIILEGQHINASFTGYNFYSAPNYPYTDFRLNVGIVWYLFT